MNGVLGIGMDLVSVTEFAEQLGRPGTTMLRSFTAGERRDVAARIASSSATANAASTASTAAARHFAVRWAAKEAVIKAWSVANFGKPPVLASISHEEIEVRTDAWGRPRIRLRGEVAKHLAGVIIHISLTHDGDTAGAFAVLERDSAGR